jgi:uncharacterized protein YjiS (DUF1127 family)
MDYELMKELAMLDIGLTEDEAENAIEDFIESEEMLVI